MILLIPLGIGFSYMMIHLAKDDDSEISSDELSLVNRGGSWGTVQELRVSKPTEHFENQPVIGVYPVPERYSFWGGSIKENSTAFDYTLSASYFKKDIWNDVTLDKEIISIPPNQSMDVNVKIETISICSW